jgi:hypothetical protein
MFELVIPSGREEGYSQLQNWFTNDGREVTILHNGNNGRKFNVFWRPIGTDQWQNTMPGFDDMLSLRCFLEEHGMIPNV